jgi:LPXTG-motif cell wall-anchored protein
LDLAGNTGNSETIYFSVEAPEPFRTTMVIAPIASVAIIGSGLLVYFRKRKKESGKKHE